MKQALRGQPVIVLQMPTDSACVIAASYTAKAFGIKTGTLVEEHAPAQFGSVCC